MPIGPEILADGWRKVTIPVIGDIEVRRAKMSDLVQAGSNPYWWINCARCLDGSRILPDGVAPADIAADIGNAIVAEIMLDRPTQARNEGCSG